MDFSSVISSEFTLSQKHVAAVIELLDEGATIPFIARYRKEKTGSMDEVDIGKIRDRIDQLRELEARKESVIQSIEKQEKLTPELEASIRGAATLAEVEDIYLPYRPKRKTRATKAREKGLEPLADLIWTQDKGLEPVREAEAFINPEKEVANAEEALQGARDILAERINEDADIRKVMRKFFEKHAIISSRVLGGKEEEGAKYRDYFDWSEKLSSVPSHRLLAMRRGEKEMILSIDISPDEAEATRILKDHFVINESAAGLQVELAVADAYKRLMKPSLETELRIASKDKADEEAIHVFADNLRQLLLSAPFGEHVVLALDPGFRTGCKLVVLDRQGKLTYHSTIYPNPPQKQVSAAGETIRELVKKFNVEAVAIGNGTASRETEQFVKGIGLPASIHVLMVNESGASIYSASEVARDEFPDHDVTVRGAVSIGRRLMDPLAELVKIDPKSIGVGQYQHDVDQNSLKKSLDDVVMSCVNSVGVELNTASKELLSYVSGLGPQLAGNIVDYRNENGAFNSRSDLLKVKRMGEKSFEQAAGFLRIKASANPLDNSAVHPESYHIVEKMASDVKATVPELMKDDSLRKKINLNSYVTDEAGLPTLEDIITELARPGRDPRDQFEVFQFDDSVHEIDDLKTGMKLPGIVTNVTNFGAFVDIGVHQDGLVHISHLSDKFVSNPAEIVSVQQQVNVTVLDVDVARKRISLSLKSDPFAERSETRTKKPSRKRNKGGESMENKLNALKNKFGG
jgi:uncharacterized protein